MKLPIFSKALGFSLLSLYVNPALYAYNPYLACPHVTCPIYVGFRPTVLASSFCSLLPTNKILKETSLDLKSFLRFSLDGRPIKFQIHLCRENIVGIIKDSLAPPPEKKIGGARAPPFRHLWLRVTSFPFCYQPNLFFHLNVVVPESFI